MAKDKKVLLVLLAAVVALGVAVFMALPRRVPVENANSTLSALPDGAYTGSCENGLVLATVRVTVEQGAIAGIEILEHRNGMGQAGEAVLERVVLAQSLDVDAVAGATASSNTLLKAVENALNSEGETT